MIKDIEPKKRRYNLYQKLAEYGIDKEQFLQKCIDSGYTKEEVDKYVEEGDIPVQINILLYKILREAEEENIYYGSMPFIEMHLYKRKLSNRVQYYYEDELQHNECPICGFNLIDKDIKDPNTPLDIYGYEKEKFKAIKYCDSCKRYHIIYKRK